MNRQAFDLYQRMEPEPVIRAADLAGAGDRLLCMGYHADPHHTSMEVELSGGELLVWVGNEIVKAATELPAADLRPTKRAYPERTDFDFAVRMRQAGMPLAFTRYPERKD